MRNPTTVPAATLAVVLALVVLGDFTPADMRALSSFQKTQCGIGGI